MSYKFRITLISILFFALISVCVSGAETARPYVALGTQPLVSPPTNPPWIDAGSVLPLTLIPGGHIWIGADNTYRSKAKKWIHLSFDTDDDASNVKAKSAVGYDPNGSTCRGVLESDGYQDNPGEEWLAVIVFEPQPDFEMIKVENEGANSVDIDKIKVEFFCIDSLKAEGYGFYFNAVTIGFDEYPLAITQLLLANEFAPVNQFVFPTLEISAPGDVWTCEYTDIDPETGLLMPQGAWLWTCIAGDGIAAGELFDASITLNECMPEGAGLLYAYDELSGEWLKFAPTVDDIEPLFPDLVGDCKIDFYDLAALADDWLRGV
ncbi:MAG: hypothetical protein WC476_04740 [Phycisphaerae bacterium]|jgi:hypothetical protein